MLKRQRETDLKDKAKRKEERRAAKRNQPANGTKGPAIDWDSLAPPPETMDGSVPEAPSTPATPGAPANPDTPDTDLP